MGLSNTRVKSLAYSGFIPTLLLFNSLSDKITMPGEASRLEKLKQLQNSQQQVRIGGKGTARRKRKVVHRTATTDDKKLQYSLKKLAVNNIPGIEEVNMIKDDGTVIHFNNPKVQLHHQQTHLPLL